MSKEFQNWKIAQETGIGGMILTVACGIGGLLKILSKNSKTAKSDPMTTVAQLGEYYVMKSKKK